MRFVRCALLLSILCGCGPASESATERYEHWLATGHRERALAYEAYLRQHGVGAAVSSRQLLRSGRHWRRCNAEEFNVPPQRDWAAITPTLALVDELNNAGLLRQAEVVSAWRSAAFNRCAGGSKRSRHLRNNALDLEIAGDDGQVERLCRYWRLHGPSRHFGLGFYSAAKVHIDTSGFRTWGYDHGRRSSLCMSH